MTTKTLDTDLLRAVRNGGKSTYKKSTLPVLHCVLIRKRGRSVEIISSDLETISRDSALAFSGGYFDQPSEGDVKDNWEVCVPEKPLLDWLRVLEPKSKNPQTLLLEPENPRHFDPSKSIENRSYFSSTPENLIIKVGGITARFKGISAEEFPVVNLSKYEGPIIRQPVQA